MNTSKKANGEKWERKAGGGVPSTSVWERNTGKVGTIETTSSTLWERNTVKVGGGASKPVEEWKTQDSRKKQSSKPQPQDQKSTEKKPANKGKYVKTNPNEKKFDDDIEAFVRSIKPDNIEESITQFEKVRDEWFAYDRPKQKLLEGLIRNQKVEFLDYVCKSTPEIMSSLNKMNRHGSQFLPLNQSVWVGSSQDPTKLKIDDMKRTFLTLIDNGSNFIDFSTTRHDIAETMTIEKRLEITESFLGALLHPNNKISSVLRSELYQYFTQEFDDWNHFKKCLRILFNKISEQNSVLFQDNVLFLISRNVDVMSNEIFKYLLSKENTSSTAQTTVETILSNPVGRMDFVEYFKTVDLERIKEGFITNILQHQEEWLQDVISAQRQLNPDVSESEYRSSDLCVIMMILGIAYKRGYLVEDVISSVTGSLMREENTIKAFGTFLETSKIDVLNLKEMEKVFLQSYISMGYGGSVRNKMLIEQFMSKMTGFEIRKEHIENFISTGSFVVGQAPKTLKSTIPSPVVKKTVSVSKKAVSKKAVSVSKKAETIPKKVLNGFACLNVDDDEEEEEEEVEEEEVEEEEVEEESYPEANPKVVVNLTSFFKGAKSDFENSLDDLKYSITKSSISPEDFAYGVLSTMIDRSESDKDSLTRMFRELKGVSRYENVDRVFKGLVTKYSSMVDEMLIDNPSVKRIIENI